MFGRLMPREARFFDYFEQHAKHAVEAAGVLQSLLGDIDHPDAGRAEIERHEKAADKITHDCIEMMHQTFITPFDRDSIHRLISTMDDILDLMEDVAQCIDLYDVHKLLPEANALGDVCRTCTEKMQSAVSLLQDMSNSPKIRALCQEIDRLETDADRLLRSAISKLFRGESDAKEIIKQKAIYEMLETITDRCEDVANIIEGIVVENA